MASEKILIVDDDADMRTILELYLKENGYQVLAAEDGVAALTMVEKESPDLIILDVIMPRLDGFELCQEIKKIIDIPIIFLSSKQDDMDKILGLGVGGDDFIEKTTSSPVLIAKIKAHLRRYRKLSQQNKQNGISEKKSSMIEYPGLVINLDSAVVKLNNQTLHLSAKEFQILCLLAQNPERIFSVEKLFELIWDENSLGDYRTVMVHISNLRKKLDTNSNQPKYIETVRGIGYKFNRIEEQTNEQSDFTNHLNR
ncbi:DNA-binding response regulator, OmpR family, contains REC and winged-helix (wHTH) domain [Gracilibacillus orientalis]|uniref:DNA-binding response regulator, OmpR family, contains REC and winged-helix (WHTH) domain n=1 Tax=Gracilibacillus orientalis TaxID=334253 RepID=A0A1I4JXU8_9BACI|nr:response regulator transcription factor [Gracilibacillus orientalis]SFL71405.1 DNA-binding response regulator, OmpR family, contains REC and winged-helix (wHTH) domain [Gracilibacillus orientalis]